jgi:hypothetical protein
LDRASVAFSGQYTFGPVQTIKVHIYKRSSLVLTSLRPGTPVSNNKGSYTKCSKNDNTPRRVVSIKQFNLGGKFEEFATEEKI